MNTTAPSTFSFARTCRLTTKAAYTAVFEQPLKLSQAWFLALYKNNQEAHARIGIIVSKRIIKNATARNYLKRQLREGFRARRPEMKNIDLVVLVRKGCNTDNKVKLRKELDSLWQGLLSL